MPRRPHCNSPIGYGRDRIALGFVSNGCLRSTSPRFVPILTCNLYSLQATSYTASVLMARLGGYFAYMPCAGKKIGYDRVLILGFLALSGLFFFRKYVAPLMLYVTQCCIASSERPICAGYLRHGKYMVVR